MPIGVRRENLPLTANPMGVELRITYIQPRRGDMFIEPVLTPISKLR